MILIDSDVGVDILRNRPPAVAWLRALPPEEPIVLPGHVVLELMFGLENAKEARQLDELLDFWSVVWLDVQGCARAMQAYRQICLANAIGTTDILIAQTAIRLGVPLHTFNIKRFKAVPGLQTIQPYTR